MPSWTLVLCVVVRWLAVGQTRINCPGHLGTGWGLEWLSQERVVMSWVTWQSSAVTGTVALCIWKALQWGSFALAVMLFAALVAVFRPSWQLRRASWILGWGLCCQGMGARAGPQPWPLLWYLLQVGAFCFTLKMVTLWKFGRESLVVCRPFIFHSGLR